MEGSTVEHSDSDSGESWTLLDTTLISEDAPDALVNAANPSESANVEVHTEKDEDTDGISIISDSDPESATADVNYIKMSTEEAQPAEQENIPLLASPPILPTDTNQNNETTRNESDFIDDKVKYKTYVHRRNTRVGTILNIIMVGTVVITAGMVLGHMWTCKNLCTSQTSVNKVLSNLYKLQEENAYLTNKLKEITDATSKTLVQRRSINNLLATKQYRCKKIFEEPVIKNNKVDLSVKCVNDNQPDIILYDPHAIPGHERELLNNIEKKKFIDLNKFWKNKEVKQQIDNFPELQTYDDPKPGPNIEMQVHGENKLKKQLEPVFIPLSDDSDVLQNDSTEASNVKLRRQIKMKKQLGPTYYETPLDTQPDIEEAAKSEFYNAVKSHRQINLQMQIRTDPNLPDLEEILPEPNLHDLEEILPEPNLRDLEQILPEPNLPDLEEILSEPDLHDQKEIGSEPNLPDLEEILPESNIPDLEEILPEPFELMPEKKITYADSLKIDLPIQTQKSENNDRPNRWIKDHAAKKKLKDDGIVLKFNTFSEDEIKKDDRYNGPKIKHDKKKQDRQKSHKKQKRNNKYEQWEMKGGYLRDFDEFSVVSSQENDILVNSPDKRFLNADFEIYVNKFIDNENENDTSNKELPKNKKKLDEKSNKMEKRPSNGEKKKKSKTKNSEWYDKRSALRAEARLKLDYEVLGENTPNNAAWYFRRMQKRENCRAQKDNSTFKKFSKRKMNFKMKR